MANVCAVGVEHSLAKAHAASLASICADIVVVVVIADAVEMRVDATRVS